MGRNHRSLLPRLVLRQARRTRRQYHGRDAARPYRALRDPRLTQIVADRLHHFDGQRYDLGSYAIMPNHVHVLFTLRDGESLPDTLQAVSSTKPASAP